MPTIFLNPYFLAIGAGILSFGKDLLKNKVVLSVIILAIFYYVFIKGAFQKAKNNKDNLLRDKQFYKVIAQAQYDALNRFDTDEKSLFNTLQGLNTDELIQVYNDFGKRKPDYLGVLNWGTDAEDLFFYYKFFLADNYLFPELTRMKNIWKNTGLWI